MKEAIELHCGNCFLELDPHEGLQVMMSRLIIDLFFLICLLSDRTCNVVFVHCGIATST